MLYKKQENFKGDNMKKLLLTTSILATLGIAGYMAYGYTPLKTYYPNGQLQSETNRKLYKKEGVYNEYYENGQLKMTASYKNDLKSGIQVNYFKDNIRLETPYVNGKKEGIAKLYYSPDEILAIPFQNNTIMGQIKLNEDTTIQIDANRQLTIKDELKGKLYCNDFELIQNTAVKDYQSRILGLAKCVAIENFTYKNKGTPALSIQFDGAFQYPKYTKTTTIKITDESDIFEKANPLENSNIQEFPEYLSGLKEYSQFYFLKNTLVTINENNKDIQIEGFNKENKKLFEIDVDATDIASIVENLYQLAQTEKEEHLFTALRNINIKKYLFLTPQGKKNLELIGKMGFNDTLIENGTHFDFYNAQEKPVIKLTKIEQGINLKITYPNGEKDLFSADLKIDCPGINNFIQKINKASTKDEIVKIQESINPFEFIPNSIRIQNLSLKNNNGQDVLLLKNLAVHPMQQSITGELQLFKEGKLYQTYTADKNTDTIKVTENGETKEISIDKIQENIPQEWFNEQLNNIAKPWIKEAEDQIKDENKTSLTFAYLGGIYGYNTAMTRYNSNTIADIVNKYTTLIEADFISHRAVNNTTNNHTIPSLAQMGLSQETDELGVQITAKSITKEGIDMHLTFPNEELCNEVAKILETTCENKTISQIQVSESIKKELEKQIEQPASQPVEQQPIIEPADLTNLSEIKSVDPSIPTKTVQHNANADSIHIEPLKPSEQESISTPSDEPGDNTLQKQE